LLVKHNEVLKTPTNSDALTIGQEVHILALFKEGGGHSASGKIVSKENQFPRYQSDKYVLVQVTKIDAPNARLPLQIEGEATKFRYFKCIPALPFVIPVPLRYIRLKVPLSVTPNEELDTTSSDPYDSIKTTYREARQSLATLMSKAVEDGVTVFCDGTFGKKN
jgi:hypothetical protein